MEDTIAEKLLTIAENEQNVFNAGYEKGLASGGVTINNQDKTITENGVYQADEGYTGLGTVTVEVASTGGGDIDALIDGSITDITSNVESIGKYAFYDCTALKTVDFPLLTSIGDYAFNNCGALETADFPLLTSIGTYVFNSCSALKTVNFPLLTSIGTYAFNSCKALETADFPLLTSISGNAFYGCKALETVNFPLLTSVGGGAFRNCEQLKTADFPLLTSIDSSVFYDCKALETVNFPLLTSVGGSAFRNCEQLKTADFPLLTSIGTYAFNNCKALLSLIIRSKTICTLSNINAFTSSSIASGIGYIYVPRALVDSYKAATNWSTYASQFRALEDYTVDGTINGELDESKI